MNTSFTTGARSSDGSSENPANSSLLSQDNNQCAFGPEKVMALFSLHWLASLAIFTFGVVLLFKPLCADDPCLGFYLLVYLRAGFWFGTYILSEKLKAPCRLLIAKHYPLYCKMTTYRKAPLQIVSFWNTTLIAVNAYARHLLEKSEMESSGKCKLMIDSDLMDALAAPQLVIVIFCGIESVALSCFYVAAIVQLVAALRISSEQYKLMQKELSVNQVLGQQAERIKLLQRQYQRNAAIVGEEEDD